MQREQRRLAAILAADVVGYSRLMGRDESGTLSRLKAHRSERLEPTLTRNGGRLVKLTGDGALAEFGSAVDALRAAIEFQQAVAEANLDQPEDTRIVFRIGLHLGDLIVDGDDLYGDGVNIAARLEAEAPPGGVVVSRAVREAVQGRLRANLLALGELTLKNIDRPIRAFRVEWIADDWPAPKAVSLSVPPVSQSESAAALPLPDKPSIAVLPFQNMSGDPEQEYFADGMVEDIITALSRTKALFVIARNSSFAFKGKSPDVRQVGTELGVRYVLEGSVRKLGQQLRITGQLVEAANGTHLWADHFDGNVESIFELQDQVTSRVVASIAPAVERSEMERAHRKPTDSLKAYDLYLRARALQSRYSAEVYQEAVALLRQALGLDPKFAWALTQLAFVYSSRKTWEGIARPEDVAESESLCRRGLALDRNDPQVLANAGYVIAWMAGRIEEGDMLLQLALERDPNLLRAWNWRGWVALMLCRPDGQDFFERAMRLSPLDPLMFGVEAGLANAHFQAERYELALHWAMRSRRRRAGYPQALWASMGAHALSGHLEEARADYAEYRQIQPAARLSNLNDWTMIRDGAVRERYIAGFRLAGMPE